MQFTDLNLDERIVRALSESGIETCTRVQDECLVHTLAGRDVTVQSQTGTGKTIAFLVTAFQRSIREGGVSTRTLIVAPTRELAVQIHREAELVGKHLDHRTGCFYGGVGYGDQERLLRDGVDVVIGTPGRLLDYAGSGKIDMRTFGVIIIDEADRLFDMGFIPDLRRIMRSALPPTERQTMLFSATLGERVKQLAWEYMNDPVSIEIEPDVVTVREVTQVLYHIGRADKMRLLLGIIKKENPQRALIFTNTKSAAETVAKRLEANGLNSRFIMGDLPQSKRLHLISDMKAGRIPILVATDVAARGLHIDDVDLVVNFDIPEDRESYVHRIGRTARAGKSGKAVSLACERYVYGLEGIETFINMKIPVGQITEELLPADASAGMRIERAYGDERRRDGGFERGRGGGRGPARRPDSRREAPSRATGASRGERRPVASGAGGGRSRDGARGDGARQDGARGDGARQDGARRQGAHRDGARGDGARGGGAHGNGAGREAASRGAERKAQAGAGSAARVSRQSSLEERKEYYRAKYDRAPGGGREGSESTRRPTGTQSRGGERRAPAEASAPPPDRSAQSPVLPTAAPAPRRSLLDKLRGLFRGKGKGAGETSAT